MGLKIFQWDDSYARAHLKKITQDAIEYRRRFERQWRKNEATIYHQDGMLTEGNTEDYGVNINDIASYLDVENPDSIGVNYTFKNFRFLAAQMSSNPPTVIVRPTSSDIDDRRKADAADRLVRHAIRRFKMQKKMDQAAGRALLYGTGWMKTIWNKEKGVLNSIDERTGEITLSGELDIVASSTWDIYIDPFAKEWNEVRYVIERKWMSKEEARMYFPKQWKKICSQSEQRDKSQFRHAFKDRYKLEEKPVWVYCYWEKGMPINGMAGRYVEYLDDGTLLSPVYKNPFSFSDPKEDGDAPPTAQLPFHVLTDIDVSDQVYGKSFIEYDVEIQDVVNRLDTLTLDNVQNHGAFRMVLPEGTEIADDSITDDSAVIIKVTGNQGPHYVSPPQSPPDMSALRDRLTRGIDSMAGVNESMFGQQSRETSGFSMQYATNQGNMIRRLFFNKYVEFVESVYKSYLNLIRDNWAIPEIIQVLGKEKAFESVEISGADIDSGFDIVVEYGASLSLDPTSRREEIMQLMPIFEKYGVDGKTIIRMLKLNELEGIHDINDRARERQIEDFEEIVSGNGDVYVKPQEMQEHDGRLAYCYEYIEGSEYRDLSPRVQRLIRHHIREREELKAASLGAPTAQEANAGNNPPGPAGGLGPAPGPAPGMPAELPQCPISYTFSNIMPTKLHIL